MTEAVGQAPAGQMESLCAVLDLVRTGEVRTRPEILRASGLGRNVVTQRVQQLLDSGLIIEGELGASTGGRAPRQLRFAAEAGCVLVADLGVTRLRVGIADLAGRLTGLHDERCDVAHGPDTVLARIDEIFRALLAGEARKCEVWGVGIGLPGPVEFASGRAVSPPIMPGWDRFPVRDYFATRYNAPVWVDNDVNVMALGESRGGVARGEQDVVFVKVGSGIGAGLISGGQLHRGAQGCAGDLGHVAVPAHSELACRCGRLGCLETLAGGAALVRDATAAAVEGRSAFLGKLLQAGTTIEAADVARGAGHGDRVCVDLLNASGHMVGETLASIVNFFNPSLIILGGVVAETGDSYLAAIRERVFSRSLPLATRDLRILRSPLGNRAGLIGAAFMVIDELLSSETLAAWIDHRAPVGRPELAEHMLSTHASPNGALLHA